MSIISFVRSLFSPKVSAEKSTQDILSKTSRISPSEFQHLVEKSELSNPEIHKVPYGFYKSHYRVLEYVKYYESRHMASEVSWIGIKHIEKSADKRASELWRMWFLNVRVQLFKLPNGLNWKRNYYSINKKGREALINFNHKF